MTTIAFDGKTMACDSCWADGDVIMARRTKILRFPSGVLYGGAGGFDDREFIDLLKKVKKPEQLPTLAELGKIRQTLRALLVFPDHRCFVIDTCRVNPGEAGGEEDGVQESGLYEIDFPCAVGSGGKYARASMAAGTSAYEAVRHACDIDLHSREPIYRLTLHPRTSVKKKKRR